MATVLACCSSSAKLQAVTLAVLSPDRDMERLETDYTMPIGPSGNLVPWRFKWLGPIAQHIWTSHYCVQAMKKTSSPGCVEWRTGM